MLLCWGRFVIKIGSLYADFQEKIFPETSGKNLCSRVYLDQIGNLGKPAPNSMVY